MNFAMFSAAVRLFWAFVLKAKLAYRFKTFDKSPINKRFSEASDSIAFGG